MLDLAFVLALAQTCAPAVAPQTLAAIAYVESRFDPLAIGVNRGGSSPPRQASARQAAATAQRLLRDGANLDLGLAQINSDNLAWLGLTVEEAFDPCLSLAASATVLRAGYRPIGNSPGARQTALRVALSRYNTGHPQRGFRNGYVGRVETAAVRLSLTLPSPADILSPVAPVQLAVEAPPAAWDIFARARARADVLIPVSTDIIGSSPP